MAGLIAFFGKGGRFLSEEFPDLSFTTGHAYTIANILEIAKRSADKAQLRLQDATVAVVGAAGSIGSGCAKLFTEMGVPRLILVDILWQEHLAELSQTLSSMHPQLVLSCSNRLQDITTADLIVVATNSPRTIIEASMLKPGAIIIDDAFPKNVPEKIAKERDDLIALEGGIVRLPYGIDIDRGRNVPNVMDVPLTRMVSCHEVYGCFAETLTLAAIHHNGNYGLGLSDPVLAKDIFLKAQGIGFRTAPLQFFGQAINEKRFQRAVQARNQDL
jgi:predicted amino acid dehydrogenase